MVKVGAPLSATDWRPVQLATEIVFASNIFECGLDWPLTTGLGDEETIRLLRTSQRKIGEAGMGRREGLPG